MDIQALNNKFSIQNHLDIVEEKKGFPFLKISNQYATAVISLYGGQVLSYKKQGYQDLLFLSECAYYEKAKAIKGGIPVCWPWFGNDPENKGRPAHGFARNALWSLLSTKQLESGATEIVMQLTQSEQSKQLWPYDFELRLEIVVSDELSLNLCTKNTDNESFIITQALHTYFSVADISETYVHGLDGCDYLDKAKSNTGPEDKTQIGKVVFEQEVDRIYLNVPDKLVLEDKAKNKRVKINSQNNKTAVVWNPWEELSKQSTDLDDDAYKRFVCIETANAANDIIKLEPGKSFNLFVTYQQL